MTRSPIELFWTAKKYREAYISPKSHPPRTEAEKLGDKLKFGKGKIPLVWLGIGRIKKNLKSRNLSPPHMIFNTKLDFKSGLFSF